MIAAADTAATFHRLHHGAQPLVLANAWDAGSARLFESLGAPAIATSSAAVAWSQGYPDGDALPLDRLVAVVGSIARVVRVPLTVDAESGYGADAAAGGAAVARLIDAGAVGINIEDGSGAPDLLCARIERAKQAGVGAGIDLFVNARTDVYLRGLVPEAGRAGETIARAARYRGAGADGVFVPGLIAAAEIRKVAAAVGLPLNLLAWRGLPPVAELARLGVRRLSAGSAIAESVWGHAGALARAFLQEGRSDPLSEGAADYGEMNALFAER